HRPHKPSVNRPQHSSHKPSQMHRPNRPQRQPDAHSRPHRAPQKSQGGTYKIDNAPPHNR
ncbi:MAG: hypothetical protein IJC28_02820, partial [Mailhella sp.]|nr:hypothetical protein [Mailhella sp.]